MPVSATTLQRGPDQRPTRTLRASAFSRLGQAEVAYRQPGGPGSPLPGPRIFLNILPDGESANGAEFEGARVLDPGLGGGAAAVVGPPSIDIDEQQGMRLLYDANGTPRVIEGAGSATSPASRSGRRSRAPNRSPSASWTPRAAASPRGRAKSRRAIRPWPCARTSPAAPSRRRSSRAARAAKWANSSVGRSGLGDGIVAFRQGEFGNAAIVAAQATAPPAPFVVTVPKALGEAVAGARLLAAGAERGGSAHIRLVARRPHRTRPGRARLTARVNPRGLVVRPPPAAGPRHRPQRPVDAERPGEAAGRRRAPDA